MPRLKVEDLLILNSKKADAWNLQWDGYLSKIKDAETRNFLMQLKNFRQEHADLNPGTKENRLETRQGRESFLKDLNGLLGKCKEYCMPKAGDGNAERAFRSDLLKFRRELNKDCRTVMDNITAQNTHDMLKLAGEKQEYTRAFTVIDKLDPVNVINSREFRGVKNGLKAINKLLKNAKDPLSEEQLEQMSKLSQQITNNAESYIAMKEDKVKSGKALNPLEQQRVQAMKVLQKSFSLRCNKINEALGKETVTSANMAEAMKKQADKVLGEQQLKEKPDRKVMRRAIALRQYAKKLNSLPKGHIYNPAMAEKNLGKILSEKDFEKKADLEIEDVNAEFAKQAAEHKADARNQSFFFKTEDGKPLFPPGTVGRFTLSVGREAMNMLATAHMLKQGYSLKEIFSSDELKNERLQAGEEVMNNYRKLGDEEFKSWVAESIHEGLTQGLKELNQAVEKMPEISGRVLNQPENSFIHPALAFMQSLGQEYDHSGIRDTIFQMYGKENILNLVDEQMGLSVPLSKLTLGQTKALELANIEGPDATGAKLQENMTSIIEAAAVEKNISKFFKPGKEPFSTQFNRNLHPEEALNVMNLGSTIGPGLEGFYIKTKKGFNADLKGNMRKMGEDVLKGKLFTKNDIIKCENGEFETRNMSGDIKKIANRGKEIEQNLVSV